MVDRLIFAQTFEGLLRCARPLEPSLEHALRALGLDPSARLEPAYPVEVFRQVMGLLGPHLAPGQPPDEQAFVLGQRFMAGYEQTLVGRAMMAVFRVIGPERGLERLARQFRTGNNFSETRVRRLRSGVFEVWCNQVTLPGWYRGLITAGLSAAGARNLSVAFTGHDAGGGTFEVRWG